MAFTERQTLGRLNETFGAVRVLIEIHDNPLSGVAAQPVPAPGVTLVLWIFKLYIASRPEAFEGTPDQNFLFTYGNLFPAFKRARHL
jgi:hypothetical protein